MSTYSAWLYSNQTMLEKISHQSTLSLAVPMSLVCFLVCVNILISTETNGGAGDLQSVLNGILYFLGMYPGSSLGGGDELNLESFSNSTDSPTSKHSLAWIAAPILLVVMVAVILVLCWVGCHWIYKTGSRRYWGRVQNEHLVATARETSPSTQEVQESSEEPEDNYSDQKKLFSA